MSYTKNVAVIKGLQDGFSVDGGKLSGIVRAERYSSELRVEISLINFAPLTEGRYVAAISDGPHTQIIENCLFEGRTDVNTDSGFAAVICYVNNGVQLIASAVCGNYQAAAFGLKGVIESAERIKTPLPQKEQKSAAPVENYEDEAIAEENYYEFKSSDEGGEPVCKNTQKEEDGVEFCKDEAHSDPVEKVQNGIVFGSDEQSDRINLARGGFFEKMKDEIEGLLSAYPSVEELCAAVDGSEWVKISYGEDNFYVFGVIYSDGSPRYICYGIPTSDSSSPPASMRGLASFLGVKTAHGVGFWVMYQDADTGASVRVSST